MPEYYGDFSEDETVYIPFNTFSSDDPSASVTITDLADADVKVHKDGGTTAIATDGATVAINFPSAGVAGNHLITIDTSVHADYATGSDYLVRIEGTTVDGATINAWVGSFSIENRFMRGTDSAATATALTTAQNDLDTLTGSDGVTLATSQPNYAPATAAALATHDGKLDTVDGIVDQILVDTGTTLPARFAGIEGATFSTSTDSLEAIRDRGDAAWVTGAGGSAPTVTEIRQEMDSNSTQLAAIVADTNELQTNQGDWITATGFATAAALTTVDTEVGQIKTRVETALPNAAPGDTDGLHILGENTADCTYLGVMTYEGSIEGDIDGNVLGSVQSVTGNVGGIAGTLNTLDQLDAAQDSQHMTTQAAVDALPTLAEILAGGDVDGYTIEETLKLCLSALAGKLSGANTTTITIRSAADDANRITATVDANGNRSAVTLNAS
jgi:hypothetical protein